MWCAGWQGCGIVEFERAADAERAITELHDSQAGPPAPLSPCTSASAQAVMALLHSRSMNACSLRLQHFVQALFHAVAVLERWTGSRNP